MNKLTTPTNIIALIITALLSFTCICTYTHHPSADYNQYFDIIKFLTPGILYIVYLSFAYSKQLNKNSKLLLFTVYPLFYCFAVIIGYVTWGFTVPAVGFIGAVFTKIIFSDIKNWIDKDSLSFGLLGLVTSLIGVILFFVFMRQFNLEMGIGMGVIISAWQIVVGLRLMKLLGKEV